MSAPELVFDPDTHTFAVGGRAYPSVTKILKTAGLIAHGDLQGDTNEYLERGRAVHAAIHALLTGADYAEGMVPGTAGYVDSFMAWFQQQPPDTIDRVRTELPLHDPDLGYAGITDLFDGEMVWDYKTGGVCRWHAIQTAAYAALLTRHGVASSFPRRGCLYLQPDGRMPVVKVHQNGWDLEAFKACLILNRWKGVA